MTSTYDAIVVGAGHNGLTAAAYLARAGFSVLVVERRPLVGGCCVTEEIAPGCRASTTSYIASMLRPEVIHDLGLAHRGLRMVPCDPYFTVPRHDGPSLSWWADRSRIASALAPHSARDAAAFLWIDDRLKRLARYLQPFFLEPPPDIDARGVGLLRELLRVARRFHRISGREIADLVSFMTGSLGDFLDRHFESDTAKTLILANNVYGKHGGPYDPGTAIGLLFHLLSGGNHKVQGFSGHVIGGMGAITRALALAAKGFGAEIRTSAPVGEINVREGRVYGVTLENGSELRARCVLSNADPKRTFLGLVGESHLPEEFHRAVNGIKMAGPCAKVNLVLGEEPKVHGIPSDYAPSERANFTILPSLKESDRLYDAAKRGEVSDDLWVDCVVASNVDVTLAPPGRHIMTCFVQYVPYALRDGTWHDRRDELRDRVLRRIEQFAPNVPCSVEACQTLAPLDLEDTYGLTEGNIFHGDLSLEQLFFMRPVPGWAHYETPVRGLYLCGAGAHPGGGVTGAPGHNAARRVLRDRKTRRF